MLSLISIGSGTFGIVYQDSNHKSLAIKKFYSDFNISKKTEFKNGGCLNDWKEISDITCTNQNLVPIFGVLLEGQRVCAMMELMPYNLESYLQNNPNIALDKSLSIIADVSCGIEFLHSSKPPCFHGNLHSNNVFLTKTLQAKVGDLMPMWMIQKYFNERKLRGYSPRVVINCSFKSLDIFALGLIACHALTKQIPMPRNDTSDLSEAARYEFYFKLIPDEVSNDLVLRCLCDDPSKRPSVSAVYNTIKDIMKDLSRTKSETLIAECTAHASINADRENTVNVVLPTQEIVMLTDNAEKTTSPTKSVKARNAGNAAALVSGGSIKPNLDEDTASHNIDRETLPFAVKNNDSDLTEELQIQQLYHEEVCFTTPGGRGIVMDCIATKIKSAVCLINIPDGRGTAFIAQYTACTDHEQQKTGLFLVSNHHVMIGSAEDASVCINNSEIVFRPSQAQITIKLAEIASNRGSLFNDKLDICFIKLSKENFAKVCQQKKLSVHPINLNDYATNIKNHDIICIYQYPGSVEQLSWSSSECGVQGPFLVYKCGTENGSSGSPILKVISKDRMKIAGIHRKGYDCIESKRFHGYNFGTLMSEIIKFIHNDNYDCKAFDIKELHDFAKDILH